MLNAIHLTREYLSRRKTDDLALQYMQMNRNIKKNYSCDLQKNDLYIASWLGEHHFSSQTSPQIHLTHSVNPYNFTTSLLN